MGCLNKWLGKNRNCPQCRNPCQKENVVQLYLSPNLEENNGSRLGLGPKIDKLPVVLGNKIDGVSKAVENFKTTVGIWENKNLQLAKEKTELVTLFSKLIAKYAEMEKKMQSEQHNRAIEQSNFRTSIERLEKDMHDMKAKFGAIVRNYF
jgi:SMC interacting uncharacterized protein involved in chromosome segregation